MECSNIHTQADPSLSRSTNLTRHCLLYVGDPSEIERGAFVPLEDTVASRFVVLRPHDDFEEQNPGRFWQTRALHRWLPIMIHLIAASFRFSGGNPKSSTTGYGCRPLCRLLLSKERTGMRSIIWHRWIPMDECKGSPIFLLKAVLAMFPRSKFQPEVWKLWKIDTLCNMHDDGERED